MNGRSHHSVRVMVRHLFDPRYRRRSATKIWRFSTGMHRLNPKRWHAATWAAVFLWSALSIWANVPHDSHIQGMSTHIEEIVANVPTQLPAGKTVARMQGELSVGFPFTYLTYTKSPGTPPRRSYLSALMFAGNVFFCVAAMAALVLCTQHKDQFSTKTLLAVVAGAAVLIACFPLTDSLAEVVANRFPNHTFPFLLPYLYVLLLYFSPIPIAVVLHCKTRSQAEQRNAPEIAN